MHGRSDSTGGWELRGCQQALLGPTPCLIFGRTECWSIGFVPQKSEVHISILHTWFLEGTIASTKTKVIGAVYIG